MYEANCLRCATPLASDAKFCGSCGSARGAGNQATAAPGSRSRRKSALISIIAVAALFIALDKLDVLNGFLQGFKEGLGLSSPRLSVEIMTTQGYNPSTHFGFVRITNLADEPVKLLSVSINHSKDTGCSFGPKASPLEADSILKQGGNVMLGTAATIIGACGAIVSVSIETDKGSGEFKIDQ